LLNIASTKMATSASAAAQTDIPKMTVGLLGMAFKAEIDDTCASLSYKLNRTLEMCAREVLTTDPFVTTDLAIMPLDEVVARSDILILCTSHSVYAEADLRGSRSSMSGVF